MYYIKLGKLRLGQLKLDKKTQWVSTAYCDQIAQVTFSKLCYKK